MASELECPICAADIPVSGEEKVGEEVVCPYCNSPCRIKAKPDDGEFELVDDC